MTIVGTRFDRVVLDIVGPLSKSKTEHQYILVLIDYVTQYTEAIPLREATDPQIAEKLLKWILLVGVPRKIINDQGTNFMLGVLKAICQVLGIKHLRT